MICSFDFDGTLTRPEVFEYARELQRRGFIVCITTARSRWVLTDAVGENPNADLLAVANDLNECRVNFIDTSHRSTATKMELILGCVMDWCCDIAFHLDDDTDELTDVGEIGVDVTRPDWRNKCEEKLK